MYGLCDWIITPWLVALLVWVASLLFAPLGRLASYGKLASSSIPFGLSRAVGFKAMYIVGCAWTVVVLLIFGTTMYRLMAMLHLGQRAYESLCVHRFSNARMSYVGLAMGVVFYICVPLNDLCSYPQPSGVHWVALMFFAFCCVRQHHCHVLLANLRPNGGNAYVVPPQRDEFAFTTTPHYLYECGVYICLAALARSHWGWQCAAFVCANQIGLSIQTRTWYRSHRSDMGK